MDAPLAGAGLESSHDLVLRSSLYLASELDKLIAQVSGTFEVHGFTRRRHIALERLHNACQLFARELLRELGGH